MSPANTPRETIAVREFARRDGCTPKLIRNARASGRLECNAAGLPYADQAGGPWRPGNRTRGDAPEIDGDGSTASPLPPDGAPPEILVASADAFVREVLDGRWRSRGDAEQIKENALALKQILDVRRIAGALVDRAAVVDASFRAARAERDALLSWPARIAPLIAADMGIEPGRLSELLSEHVHELLRDLGNPEIDLDPRN